MISNEEIIGVVLFYTNIVGVAFGMGIVPALLFSILSRFIKRKRTGAYTGYDK